MTAPGAGPLRVSLAHTADRAVALVRAGAGPGVGVDVEPIAPRAASFTAVAFTDAELALGAGRPADEWMTRLWTAKEAAAKARGTGLGDPRRTPVRAADGDRLDVDGVIVETRRDGDLVVAWTLDEAAATP